MKSNAKTKILYISDMTCMNCQNRIEKKLQNTAGIQLAEVSYNHKTAKITYDNDIISYKNIIKVIEKLDYTVVSERPNAAKVLQALGILVLCLALSTGSLVTGAVSMLLFSLGTVPLMFGFGALSTILSNKFTHWVMMVGFALVVVLGLSMFSHCFVRSGFTLPTLSARSSPTNNSLENSSDETTGAIPANVTILTDQLSVAQLTSANGIRSQTVHLTLTNKGFEPAVFVVQAGIDVKWVIQNNLSHPENTNILVPFYNTQMDLVPGENSYTLYPTKSFDFSNDNNTFYGYMKVVADLNTINKSAIQKEATGIETYIWPSETFQSPSRNGYCCSR
jgi:copper chaperone CopZ